MERISIKAVRKTHAALFSTKSVSVPKDCDGPVRSEDCKLFPEIRRHGCGGCANPFTSSRAEGARRRQGPLREFFHA